MITLGLLRAFRKRGVRVTSAKSGPDYIDPQFHKAASGAACVNLDAWAMPPAQLRGLAGGQDGELLIVEGAMGLFDGAPDAGDPMGRGSVADLVEVLDFPVVLVLDAAKLPYGSYTKISRSASGSVASGGMAIRKKAAPERVNWCRLLYPSHGSKV